MYIGNMKLLPRYTKYHILSTSAYTLVEILIGLTIIALLFGFSYAGFRDFSRRQALSGAAKKVQGDLRLAKELALAGQKPEDPLCDLPANSLQSYSFNINSANSYRIEANCSGGVVINKEVSLPPSVSISTPAVNPVKFKVIGQGTNIPDATNITITLTQSGTNSQIGITVSSGGEIK